MRQTLSLFMCHLIGDKIEIYFISANFFIIVIASNAFFSLKSSLTARSQRCWWRFGWDCRWKPLGRCRRPFRRDLPSPTHFQTMREALAEGLLRRLDVPVLVVSFAGLRDFREGLEECLRGWVVVGLRSGRRAGEVLRDRRVLGLLGVQLMRQQRMPKSVGKFCVKFANLKENFSNLPKLQVSCLKFVWFVWSTSVGEFEIIMMILPMTRHLIQNFASLWRLITNFISAFHCQKTGTKKMRKERQMQALPRKKCRKQRLTEFVNLKKFRITWNG